MKRYHITVGAKTTAGGTVRTGWAYSTIDGQAIAREGDEVDCPQCASTGLIVCDGPHLVDLMDGRNAALDGDLCQCQCDPPPRLIANQTLRSQLFEDRTLTPRGPTTGQPLNNHLNRPASTTPGTHGVAPSMPFGERPGLGCENLWRGYQQRAEAIVAPGGRLLADPRARNRAINAAYARLWLDDRRFQWAGLAAFASKQVGCGLLHATDSIEKIQAQHEAAQDLLDSAERRWQLPGLTLFGKTDQQAQHHYEQTRKNNPVPGIDLRRDGEPLSLVQQQLQSVHDMLALGNTTLFLDVYPLHVFYKEQGLLALTTCLDSRQKIYGNDQHLVLWPIEQQRLRFGYDHKEILQAFEAIDAGSIVESVVFLAEHEQKNILQPAMYGDLNLVALLVGNHLSYVTNFPSGAAAAVELTLASQCRPSEDGRTVGFSNNYFANLADIHQRMPFVLKAAAQFDELLRRSDRHLIEHAILDIAAGLGVR
jgi:uncharacterized Zn-binding protein involved in type VI secretion